MVVAVRKVVRRVLNVSQKQNRPQRFAAGGSIHDRLDTVQISPVPSDVQVSVRERSRNRQADSKAKADSILEIGFCGRR
jgi:hypothetical protein